MSSVLKSEPASPLRLFLPDLLSDEQTLEVPPPDPKRFTLRECYAEFLASKLTGDREGTAEQFLNALWHWERCTSNPAVISISDEVLAAFQKSLEDAKEHAAPTINKILRHVRGILLILGPRGGRKPGAKNILPFVPWVEPLTEDAPEKRPVRPDHLASIYERCDVAHWPRLPNVHPTMWWRCVVALSYNLGLRTRDLLRREWNEILEGDEDQPAYPRPDTKYLRFTPKKTKRTKPGALYLPINSTVELHLRHLDRATKRILHCPNNEKMFYRTWKAIQHAAGIKRLYKLKNLRVTCNTRLNRTVPGAGKHVLGHGQRADVNIEHYDQVADDVYLATLNLPQPEVFLRGPAYDVARQLSLGFRDDD